MIETSMLCWEPEVGWFFLFPFCFPTLLKKSLDFTSFLSSNNILHFFLGGRTLATHASALKRARQSEKKRIRNVSVKSALKTHAKKVLQAVESKNSEEARKALASAIPAFQKAAGQRVIHQKTAARKISGLAKKVNSLSAPA
jgi:small subunit ribosomal protein S20